MDENRLRPALWLWAINILLGVLLSFSFLERVSPSESAAVALFGVLGLFSSMGMLSLVPGLLSVGLCTQTNTSKRAWGLGFIWTLAILILFIDTRLHGFYGYHINSTVMGAVFTPGIEQSVSIGWGEVLPLIVIALALFPAQVWLAKRHPKQGEFRWAKCIVAASVLGFLALPVLESWAGPHFHGAISERVEASPGPQFGDPIGEFLEHLEERNLVDFPVPLLQKTTKPNFLILVLDCLRADAINAEDSPRLNQFAKQSMQFQNHLSGGNWTQHGVFTLLYGLHGTYWEPVLEAKQPPPLIEALRNHGWEFRITAAAAQTFPAFRSTAWVSIPDAVYDQFPGKTPAERDLEGIEAFGEWMENRNQETPFFAFFLLDATHQVYSFPEESAVFHPYEKDIRYLPISYGTGPAQRIRIRNRYRNAVHYADSLVAKILQDLEKSGQADNTVILITGDHGEEFWEHEIWGHSTNFSREQLHVPLFLKGPGISPGLEERPTSHIDIPQTLLEFAGASPTPATPWSLGHSLLRAQANRPLVSAGWQGLAVRHNQHILFLPGPEGGRTSAFTEQWERVADPSDLFRQAKPVLDGVLKECNQFLQSPKPN